MTILKKLDLRYSTWNTTFHIYIDNNRKYVYKKVRKSTKEGKKLTQKLKDPYTFKHYKDLITNTGRYPYRNFTISGYDVEPDGSYKCKYIKGYVLESLKKYKIRNRERSKIIKALMEFKVFHKKYVNKLNGDWAPCNLVYSIEDERIYNIDLEGFFTWKGTHWMHIEFINRLIRYLRS